MSHLILDNGGWLIGFMAAQVQEVVGQSYQIWQTFEL